MICENCGRPHEREGRTLCFGCHVRGVSLNLRGGAVVGNNGWNISRTDWIRENMGVDSEKQLAKRTDIERV
jgi:hypothetical protein